MNSFNRLTELFFHYWETHRGRMVGVLIGFFIGVLFLTIGFLSTLLLLVLMIAGYLLGKRIDNKEDILELLDRILPPGYHK